MRKMILIIIFLFCELMCSASIAPYLELSKIDLPAPYDNYHALYLNIYNTTDIPNFKITVKGTNVAFDWTRFGVFYSNLCVNPIDAQRGQLIFKEGHLSRQPFMLFGRLMYSKTSNIGSIEIISIDDFNIGSTYYPKNYIIDSISTPEPSSTCLLAIGLLFIRIVK